MTLSSIHRIRNSSTGGLRPSTLPLGHGGSPQYWLSHVDGEETCPWEGVVGTKLLEYFRSRIFYHRRWGASPNVFVSCRPRECIYYSAKRVPCSNISISLLFSASREADTASLEVVPLDESCKCRWLPWQTRDGEKTNVDKYQYWFPADGITQICFQRRTNIKTTLCVSDIFCRWRWPNYCGTQRWHNTMILRQNLCIMLSLWTSGKYWKVLDQIRIAFIQRCTNVSEQDRRTIREINLLLCLQKLIATPWGMTLG